MSGVLDGKVAVVTAAAQGIGRASAELFARAGAEVWATDVDDTALKSALGLRVAKLDVLDDERVAEFFAAIGPVDVLFNCAGFVAGGSVLSSAPEEWARSFDLNVMAMVRTIRAVLPSMVERRSGSIVNMASVASSIKGVPDRCVYGTTKAAVIGLTKSVAADFVKHGVRVNAICPGTVDTPSLRQRLTASGDFQQAWDAFTARQPMGRLGNADEIAALALYLASDVAAFTTGQAIAIDGGWTI